MKHIKKIIVAITSSSLLLLVVGQAGATLKSQALQIRSARLYHTYSVMLTQFTPPSGGTFSPPPSGGTFSPPPSGGTFSPPPSGGTMMPPPPGGTPGALPGGDVGGHSFSPPPSGGTFSPPPSGGTFSPPPSGGTMMPPPPGGTPGMMPGGQFGGQNGPNEICKPGTPCGPQGQFGPPPGSQGGFGSQGQFGGQQQQGGQGQGGFGGEQGGDQGRKFQFNRGGQEQQGGQGQGGFGGEQGGMSEQDQEKFQQQQDERMLKEIKRGLGQMSRMLGPMNSQIAKLEKQGVTVPQELKDTITKVSNLLIVVKSAKTMDEVLAAGFEDLQDWMQTIQDGHQLLEMAARWGQTIKQVDQQLKRLVKVLNKDKALAQRIKIDLSSQIVAFEAAVNELVAVRDRASELAKTGDIEGAYGELEENFFNKMDDVMQYDQVIQTVSRLGKFESEFKRRYAQAQREVNGLKRHKIDVTEMNALMAQIAAKGDEIKGLIHAQPLDSEAVFEGLSSLEDLVQNLEALMAQASGEKEELPWEQGKDQFKQVELPSSVGNLFTPTNQGQ